MARKPLALLLSPDATQSSIRGIPAAALERPDRAGKQMLAGYIDRMMHEQFRALACELHRTNADLLREAINDLFNKYGKRPAG